MTNEILSQSVHWQKMAATAGWAVFGATLLSAAILFLTFLYIRRQFKAAEKRRVFDITLSVFEKLQTDEVRRARRYLYERVPWNIHGVSEDELRGHMIEAEKVIALFDLLGYLLREGHVSKKATLAYYWRGVWKCWKKSERLLTWARRARHEPVFHDFDHLFHECEKHRRENNYEEPAI